MPKYTKIKNTDVIENSFSARVYGCETWFVILMKAYKPECFKRG